MKEFFTLPKQVQYLQGIRFISVILGSAIFPFMSMYYSQYFGAFWTGLLVILTQAVSFLAIMYGGHLSDLLGRKKVADLGNFGVLIGYILTCLANIPGHVLPLLTFVGIFTVEVFSNFAFPAYDAMVIDLTDEDNRRYVYTISYWLVNVSVMLGAGVSGAFYDDHFFGLLLVMTLVALLTFLAVFLRFEESKPADLVFDHDKSLLSTLRNYGQVARDKTFLLYSIGTALFACVWVQVDNFIAIQYKTYYEPISLFGLEMTGAKLLSLTVFINTVMVVCLMTTVNRLTKKMALIPQFVIGSSIFAAGIFTAFSNKSFWVIVAAAVCYTMGEMIQVPAGQTLRAQMMDDNKIGSYSGFISMAHPIGIILAGGMVSLSGLTGLLGAQLAFILIAVSGIGLTVRAARQQGIKS